MSDSLHLNSIKQCQTPLNTLFFSEFNTNLIQRAIRQQFKNETGISIDYQNKDDIFAIMRVVFINNASEHYKNVNAQVKFMNEMVMKTALSQIKTGVSQYVSYVRDIDTLSMPIDRPVNTSTFGNKLDSAIGKIGIN
jgi:hypothetical protein|tara:strand:- start:37022 stop:37432 length:411 start_codon:yes stop_codon:yes gene_type:complete